MTTELLYRRHSQRVLRYCLRCLRRPADAEDALQQTFLQAHRALDRGVEPEAGAAWLLAIARNVCLTRSDALQRRSRTEVSTDPEVIAEAAGFSPSYDGVSDEVREALAALPARQREALFLREWHDLTYDEIARVLGTSEAAVETLVFRARRNMARSLEPMRSRRLVDLAGLLGWVRTGLGPASAKLAVGAAAVTVSAGTAITVVERAPAPHHPRALPAPAIVTATVRVAPVAVTRLHARTPPRARHAIRPVQPAVAPAVPAPIAATPTTATPVPESAAAAPAQAAPIVQAAAPAEPAPNPNPTVAHTATTTAASTVEATTTTATQVVSQTASTAASTVVSDTVDKTAAAASQTVDAAASTVQNTVSKLLPGH